MAWPPRLSRVFPQIHLLKLKLFHSGLARYVQVERLQDGSASWKDAAKDRQGVGVGSLEIAGPEPQKSKQKQVTARGKRPGKRPGRWRIRREKCHPIFFRGNRRSTDLESRANRP